MPEQRMHTNTPRFHEAQRGCLLRLQSAQALLLSSLTSALRAARLRSAVSAMGGGRRDMVVVGLVVVLLRRLCLGHRRGRSVLQLLIDAGSFAWTIGVLEFVCLLLLYVSSLRPEVTERTSRIVGTSSALRVARAETNKGKRNVHECLSAGKAYKRLTCRYI